MPVTTPNQWSASFTQPASFGTTPPALQSVVVPLTPANSVGGGSGTPSQGTWLFCSIGMNEQASAPGFSCSVGDDIHSFWRPGNPATSQPAVSRPSGLTRAAIWYTANTAAVTGNIYVAPSGAFDALTVLVTEVAGLGPWDTVTGIYANYAAAVTSLALSLPAPSGSAFLLGTVAGDSTTAGQTFAPAGWTALHTVSVTDGSDHLNDSVLTSAWIATSGSVSVSGSATSAADLSGVVIGVLTAAPSPVTGPNPSWPAVRLEAALGGGFQSPPDTLTWTDLSSRSWSWDETTGIQYQLGDIQSTDLTVELDNIDGFLSTDNPASPYYSNALNHDMSFEAGGGTWLISGYNGAAVSSSSAHAYSGTRSLLLTPNGVTAAPGVGSELFAVYPDSTYTASAQVFCVPGYATGVQVLINWYTAGSSFISASSGALTALGAAAWTQVVLVSATSPANAAFGQVLVQAGGTPSAATLFYLDEAGMVPGMSLVTTMALGAGTPLRIRAAIGTAGGVTVNRWYVISRNIHEWPQQVDDNWRRFIDGTGTDLWSVMSYSTLTPFRAEVSQDNPYAWYPMDDVPLDGGVLPVTLRNFARGNTNVLNIIASPNGVSSQDPYSTTGTDIADQTARTLPSVAIYSTGANQGWMYGDPQSSAQSYATSNPVTANPGSAAWQMTGGQGANGANGWFLSCNDTNFPSLSGGITVKGWFNAAFFGSAAGYRSNTTTFTQAGQPYGPVSLCTLTTGSAPVAILQLDTSGHLNLITYNGTTPTSNSIYSSSSLFSAAWVAVDILLTATTWRVLVDGGLTADVSGSGTSMTPGWSWLVLNGDMGNTAGGGTTASIQHGGNVALSHWAVFGSLLPAWRLRAQYCAATTAFGLVPAPAGVSVALTLSPTPGNQTTFAKVPDGSLQNGGYGGPFPPSGSGSLSYFSFSVLATANIGSFSSGPSARTTIAGLGQTISATKYGYAAWVSWTGVAPSFTVYTAAAADAETSAATACGSGDSFSGGFGAAATGAGVCQTAAGAGAAFPAGPSALGDGAGERLERILSYSQVPVPRCIDPAPLPVQAATDAGGQQAGQNLTAITQSDGGLLFVDNCGNLVYWQKSHLAAQYGSPAWTLGPAAVAGSVEPYYRELKWTADPQRVWNAITITPFSPDGASLAAIVPVNAPAVLASQQRYGAQPLPVTSYLQSQAEMQSQANWLFANFGTVQIRVEELKADAAPYPADWPLVLGVNPGDVVSVQNWQLAGGGNTGTFRVSNVRRHLSFGDGGRQPAEASVTLTCDFEPVSYWS